VEQGIKTKRDIQAVTGKEASRCDNTEGRKEGNRRLMKKMMMFVERETRDAFEDCLR